MHKLQGFLQIVLGSEQAVAHVDIPELLNQVWDAGQIGKESPILTDEDLQKKQSGGVNAQATQHIQEIEEEAKKLIEQANAKAQKAEQAAAEAKRQEEFKLAQLEAQQAEAARKEDEAKRAHELALHDRLNTNISTAHDTTLKQAQIDDLQASTLLKLSQANEKPSPELEKRGTEAEGAEEAKPDPIEGLRTEMQTKHDELLQHVKRATGKRKRTLTRGPKGEKMVIDEPMEENEGMLQ